MSEDQFSRLGLLYRKLGLSTPADLIALRADAARQAYSEYSDEALVPLIRAAFGLAKAGEIDFVEKALSADTAYSAEDGLREVELLASAILWELIGKNNRGAALGVVCASFGGARDCVLDAELLPRAKSVLAELQRTKLEIPSSATYRTKPKWAEEIGALAQAAANNSFSQAHDSLKTILTGGVDYSQNAAKDLATQLNSILASQRKMREQMEVHWWTLAAWSIDANNAFNGMSPAEASLRTGKELADLTTSSDVGIFAAPSLIARVLSGADIAPDEEATLKAIIISSPADWRREWAAPLLAKNDLATLLPVSFAAALAVDAEDESDWEPRFQRLTKIAPDKKLRYSDVALQLYFERLFSRLVGL